LNKDGAESHDSAGGGARLRHAAAIEV